MVLSGCGGKADRPSTLPTLSKAPSASLSPTQSPTTKPSPAGPTAASAAAFVRAYYAAVNKGDVSGRVPSSLRAYSAKGCAICQEDLKYEQYLERVGRHTEKPILKLRSVSPQAVNGGTTTVTVTLEAPAGIEVDLKGKKVRSIPPRPNFAESVALVWHKGQWLITDITDF